MRIEFASVRMARRSQKKDTRRVRAFLITAGLLIALGCIGAAVYLWDRHRDEANAIEQRNRDRSGPAYCATTKISGVAGICWTDVAECEQRKIECETVDAYACFRGLAITNHKRTKWCLRRFGDCVDYRRELLRDAEYTDISECLVYRTQGAR